MLNRISGEEYEFLLELVPEYEWIARDGNGKLYAYKGKPKLRNLIQDTANTFKVDFEESWWEDEEDSFLEVQGLYFIRPEEVKPFSIQSLIKEFEDSLPEAAELKDENEDVYRVTQRERIDTNYEPLLRYCSVVFPDDGDKVESLHKDYKMELVFTKYHYYTDILGLTYGDVVAVPTINGTKLASFVEYLEDSTKAKSIVLNKIDLQKGKDFYNKRKEKEDLEKKIRERMESASFIEQATKLAEHDEVLKNLLDAYKGS